MNGDSSSLNSCNCKSFSEIIKFLQSNFQSIFSVESLYRILNRG